jgi:hypothetical protein
MTIRANSEWLYHGTLFATAVQDSFGTIKLTMTRGTYDVEPTSVGDSWFWQGTDEDFLLHWTFVQEVDPTIPSIWINVIRWADGTTSFDHSEPFKSREEAVTAFKAEPYDIDTNEPCELVDTVEVTWRG